MARAHSSRRTELLALTGLALAGGAVWWRQREPPAAQAMPHALVAREQPRAARTAPERPQPVRVGGEAPVAPVRAAADATPAPSSDPPLAEDRALGQPHVPNATAPYLRAPDPPPPLPLDPDEVVPDDPRDFDLPARAAQQP